MYYIQRGKKVSGRDIVRTVAPETLIEKMLMYQGNWAAANPVVVRNKCRLKEGKDMIIGRRQRLLSYGQPVVALYFGGEWFLWDEDRRKRGMV